MTAKSLIDLQERFRGDFKQLVDIFHKVNRLLPEDQEVLKIPPEMKVSEALQIMAQNHFSQLPVVEKNEVLGVFSYRSFAKGVAKISTKEKELPKDLAVEEFIEQLHFARVSDEFHTLFHELDKKDSVLVGDPERLQGIITAMNVLHYLYNVANHFVLLEEIELALRALIRRAVDYEKLNLCIQESLSNFYENGKLPQHLEDMTFNDYIMLIIHGENWEYFQPIFRGTRERLRARLEPIRELRNEIFHFRREISNQEIQDLLECREWLLTKARATDAQLEGVSNVKI